MAWALRTFETEAGRAELRAARAGARWPIRAAALFSAFCNLLMLTGPIFMLQVYDRVLTSRSEETLAALFLLVTFLFAIMTVLDHARGRLMARAGIRLQQALEARVFAAALSRSAAADAGAAQGLRDLDAVQRMCAAPVSLALFDLPFAPLFLLAVVALHPWLGVLAVAGMIVLAGLAAANQAATRTQAAAAALAGARADRLAGQLMDQAETVQALGMRGAGLARWRGARGESLDAALIAADRGGLIATLSRNFRVYFQSALLALGALLVLRGEISGGAMVASSILTGRALAPVEQVIVGWPLIQRAREGWRRLALLLSLSPPEPARTALPRPRAVIALDQLSVVPPGQTIPALRGLTFRLEPGQALGIIGPSGAGKSTLARTLVGLWRPAAGSLRIGGATLAQHDPESLGALIGYLPQQVTLFEGTIAENIARMATPPDPAAVITAAQRAAAHELILSLPDGYDTRIGPGGAGLSGGQIQRIGLARALYGDPAVLVLDEPNANLDNDGALALNDSVRAIKAAGGAAIIMAHRPAAIAECDMLLVLENGVTRAFGPRDEILRAQVRNAQDIFRAATPGGLT